VFVPSLVEGRLPQSGRSPRFELPPAVLEPLVRGREDVVAEERRLLYVAMTRARRRLYLTRATHYEGGRGWRESRFLSEVRAVGASAILEKQIPTTPQAVPPIAVHGRSGEVQLSYSAITSYLQRQFDVPVDGWKLRGVIDRIDRTDSGWRIIDYKSGRPIARRRRDLQVALYALGATASLGLDPVELEVVYLASGESVR